MTTVTLKRNGTSVDIPLIDDSSGAPVISRDVGKPQQSFAEQSGALNPRHQDFRAGLETVTMVGRFSSATAYDDAATLAGLIKEQPGGTALTLEIPHNEFPSPMSVVPAPAQDGALTQSYLSGVTDDVQLELSLTRVNNVRGTASRSADIQTTSGSGPIQLTDGSTTVDIVTEVEVEWAIGQPNTTVRGETTNVLPYAIQKNKAAYEAFSISWQHVENAVANINDIVELVGQQLGRDALTLDFNGEFGLGSVSVAPAGGSALRHQRVAGEAGTALVPTLDLRRVRT